MQTTGSNHNEASAAQLRDAAIGCGIPAEDLPAQNPAPWRRLAFEGAYNFRDIGGYPTSSGGVVRRGLVYRSDNLNTLTDADLARMSALGLRCVHDFRLDKELERQPSRLPDGMVVQRLSTSDMQTGEAASMVDVMVDMLHGRRALPPASFWADNYAEMLVSGRPMFVTLLRSLAGADALPALFHCTGGKDRTGIACMLLHAVLGVGESDILDDFTLTNLYRTPVRMAALREGLESNGIPVVDAVPIIGVQRDAMVQTIARLGSHYGGPVQYLVDGGLEPDVIDVLRERLVTSSPR
jgi:protein-tyrosine phosphatase